MTPDRADELAASCLALNFNTNGSLDWQRNDSFIGPIDLKARVLAAIRTAMSEARREGAAEAWERAARICVRKSCSWSKYEDEQNDEYRRGVEECASTLAASLRQAATKQEAPPQ